MKKVSVIIPTHNRWPSLRKTLDSVVLQTEADFEVILVDDGSTDATAQEVRNHYPTVKLIKKIHEGPSSARNAGIKYSSGEWIAFLDSDDFWLPGKLKAQLDYFKSNPGLKIAQTEEIWIRNGVRVNPMKKHQKFSGWIYEKCLPLCIISPSAVMIHREIFNEVGLFDENLLACEDYDLWLRIANRYEVGLIPIPYLKKFGGHPDQQSHKFPVMDRFRLKALAKMLTSGKLQDKYLVPTKKTFDEKARIVIEGAMKRGQRTVVQEVQTLITEVEEFEAALV